MVCELATNPALRDDFGRRVSRAESHMGDGLPSKVEDWVEPDSEVQVEAEARVWAARMVRNAQCLACEHRPGVNIGEVKKEVTVQVRRARKFALEEVAGRIMAALDFDTLIVHNDWPPELVQALKRVNALAKMCRGPG